MALTFEPTLQPIAGSDKLGAKWLSQRDTFLLLYAKTTENETKSDQTKFIKQQVKACSDIHHMRVILY